MNTEDKAIDGISAFKFLAHAQVYEKKEKCENEEEKRKKITTNLTQYSLSPQDGRLLSQLSPHLFAVSVLLWPMLAT